LHIYALALDAVGGRSDSALSFSGEHAERLFLRLPDPWSGDAQAQNCQFGVW
jgi:hypothetical protein